ncbi:hypothetical protein GCM10010922_17550 [Microbacterium sorbitolivorans]|uniref:DivIVA domain-containing protein n=1 Tax=Microbacterium sorbitolivorans TaxID=1867410 RepID=A0A367Y2M0_9MICO|nr:hypothetical protein [Microbacterium sorbitolivorans]RCK60077.1 hypothetical protein DTO57_08050 [Microbacterium sorbitolivorans]GGF42543.1 hypothetical protein GCM10010922_17550 [Microbacterium sorbitolivorans]
MAKKARQPLEEWLASHPLRKPGLFGGEGYSRRAVDEVTDKIVDRLRADRQYMDLIKKLDFPRAPRAEAYDIAAVDDLFDNLKWGSDPRH